MSVTIKSHAHMSSGSGYQGITERTTDNYDKPSGPGDQENFTLKASQDPNGTTRTKFQFDFWPQLYISHLLVFPTSGHFATPSSSLTLYEIQRHNILQHNRQSM
ncbi:hypothetical protein M8J75_016427 [Diaphorina citri]|nr:hypothetical protein M8J75_016427 [Diaphorina citri]